MQSWLFATRSYEIRYRPAFFGKHSMQNQPYELFFILSPRRPFEEKVLGRRPGNSPCPLLLGKPGCKCHDFQSTLLWPGVSSFPQFLLVPSLALVALLLLSLSLLSLSLSLSLSLCLSRRPVLWIFIRSSVGSPFPFSLFLFLLSFLEPLKKLLENDCMYF